MVLLLLYCPPGALSHRSHRLHHGEAGFRRHHRWWWLVWRWPRAPSGWAGSHWIWDLIGFENVLFFFGGFNMLPHEMMIRNDDLVCPGMFYRQRTKSQTAKACESLCPEKEEACHTLRCQPKIKASYTAPQKPIAVENVSRNCGGIWRTSTMPCGCWQQLLKTDLLFFKISTFHVPTYLLTLEHFEDVPPVESVLIPFNLSFTIFFLQLPFSPSSNLIPLRHLLRRFHHQSRWICSAEGPGTLITWCCHGVDESIAFKHVRWMALDGSWQSQATQKMYAGNPSRNVLNLVLESLWLMQIVYVSFTSCPRYPMSRATGGRWWIQRLSRSCHLSCALCKTQRIRRLSGMMWHHACLRMVLFWIRFRSAMVKTLVNASRLRVWESKALWQVLGGRHFYMDKVRWVQRYHSSSLRFCWV